MLKRQWNITGTANFQEKAACMSTSMESVAFDGAKWWRVLWLLWIESCRVIGSGSRRRWVLLFASPAVAKQIDVKDDEKNDSRDEKVNTKHLRNNLVYLRFVHSRMSNECNDFVFFIWMCKLWPTSPILVWGRIKSATDITTPTVTLSRKWAQKREKKKTYSWKCVVIKWASTFEQIDELQEYEVNCAQHDPVCIKWYK